jgi:predicted N-acyltransferase
MADFSVKVASTIHNIDTAMWDRLSAGRPFQSHRWYAFGEHVMSDCHPAYLLIQEGNELIARACLWLVRNEPLPPKLFAPLRKLVSALLKRWPLLICRSPMANTSGIILPEDSRRSATLFALVEAALKHAKQQSASFVLFDYLCENEIQDWPSNVSVLSIFGPGTAMENRWNSLDEYLKSRNKKDRQHYKRSLREADKLGIRVTPHQNVPDIDAALTLIRNVEHRHDNVQNPWTRSLLENIASIGGTWLEAKIGERIVGGGVLLEDNRAQMTTAIGLTEKIPYAYFLLVYASLEIAFKRQVRLLRWGSGAYEVKQQLGFTLEGNNHTAVAGVNFWTRLISRAFAQG